jgi:hypothetical protein
MKSLSLFIILLMANDALQAQPNFEKIKKKIPVEDITLVELSPFGDNIFQYYTKSDSGLWNSKSKKIIASHVRNAEISVFSNNWFKYETINSYGIYNIEKNQILFESNHPLHLIESDLTNLLLIVNKEYVGFVDIALNTAYFVSPSTETSNVKLLEETKKGTTTCIYYSDSKKLVYRDEAFAGAEYSGLIVTHHPNYLMNELNLYSFETGELALTVEGQIYDYDSVVLVKNSKGISYYDDHLTLVFKNVKADEYTLKHFKYLVDGAITKVIYVGNSSIYLCKIGQKRQFYNSTEMLPISPTYDFVFPIGYDQQFKGLSFFTLQESGGLGLFNSKKMEILKPSFHIIEKRIRADGSYWLRADNVFFDVSKAEMKGISWESSFDKSSMIINHIGVHTNKLVISSRSISADTHDAGYYTASYFDDGSGVLNLEDTTWSIRPRYHTITPFKGHYIAMKIGSTYRNSSWLQTTIFDKGFKPITNKEFGYSFIFNDMLFIRYDGMNLIQYDVEANAVVKQMGRINEFGANFKIIDGYLVLGDNNYFSRTETLKDMDITDIISPTGNLIKVPLKRFQYVELIGDDLVIIARIKKGEPTDRNLFRLNTDAEAVFDLKTQKIISPWYRTIAITEDGLLQLWDVDSSKKVFKISTKDIRIKDLFH